MNMDILIIGGNGFLGSAITSHFLSRGHKLTVAARGTRPFPDGVESIVLDRRQKGSLANAFGARRFDLVVDCAAYQGDDIDDMATAVGGRIGHYVLISTDFVYATDIDAFPIREDARKDNVSGYAVGKLACEARLKQLHQERQFPYSVLRPPHIIGAGRELGTGSVQGRDRNLLKSMRAGGGLTLIAEGELIIQPVWNRQVAAAIGDMALKPATFGQLFNMMGPEAVTTRRYYQMVADILGVPLRYDSMPLAKYRNDYPDKRAFARHRIYDLSQLQNLADHRPAPQLHTALVETVQWMERHCAE
jgi:nucleoside-diphosphate-sugar epimerase